MDTNKLSSYDYILPENQIAQSAVQPQHDCKLLYCKIDKNQQMLLEDKIFKDIIDILTKNDVIYFNNSQVVPSRIYMSSDNKNQKIIGPDGTQKEIKNGELFWLRRLENDTHEFLVRPGSKLKTGTKIYIYDDQKNEYTLEIVGNTDEGREVKLQSTIVTELDGFDNKNHATMGQSKHTTNIYKFLEKFGNMPLPPYIGYDKSKDADYQPVFATNPGSVASPTASLHFTDYIIEELSKKGIEQNFVTLHVGMGTFKSVDVQNITDYQIHGEVAEIDLDIFDKIYQQKSQGKKIISVGTTSARTMESLPYVFDYIMYQNHDIKEKLTSKLDKECIDRRLNITKNLEAGYISNLYIQNNKIIFETRIYIFPGYKRKIVYKLITNFHLPKSSLMMLVASLMGFDNMSLAYKHAIKNNYRFYSFGDAMYIDLV